MPKEIPKQPERAQPDQEHWHGPIAGLEDTREIHILRKLTEHGLAKEELYTDPEGNIIYQVRELVRKSDGTVGGGRIIRMENETLLKQLLDEDARMQSLIQEYKSRDKNRGLALDKNTAKVVELMEMPPPKEGGKDH
ncbi:MAG: hypothetical protein AAB375_01430 [Patescibacteria group bacterium]